MVVTDELYNATALLPPGWQRESYITNIFAAIAPGFWWSQIEGNTLTNFRLRARFLVEVDWPRMFAALGRVEDIYVHVYIIAVNRELAYAGAAPGPNPAGPWPVDQALEDWVHLTASVTRPVLEGSHVTVIKKRRILLTSRDSAYDNGNVDYTPLRISTRTFDIKKMFRGKKEYQLEPSGAPFTQGPYLKGYQYFMYVQHGIVNPNPSAGAVERFVSIECNRYMYFKDI